jgi:hypothetical protein
MEVPLGLGCYYRDMALAVASAHLSDDEFLAAFHSLQITTAGFGHADHLRLAWIHLHRSGWDAALDSVRAGLQAFAAYYGLAHLYHETITAGWMWLLATHQEATFEEFLQANEARLGPDLLQRYWSPEALESEEARTGWVLPDRENLPLLPAPAGE